MNPGKLYFIPQLFKPPTKEYSAVSQNDPFVAHEVLQEYCSLFASDGSGVPSYISRDPDISSIIDFPAESWDKIAKVQMQREKIETKAEDKEATTAPKQHEVDHLKRTLDQTVDRIFNKHGFFVKKPCPVMIPYKSTLNHAEHKAYLRAFVKFKIRAPTTAADASEYGQYLRLQHRVYEEQNCFMQFSHQVSRLQLPAYNLVPDVIKNYVNDYVQHRCKRSSNYKTLYVHEQQVPICPQDPTKRFHSLSLTHIGHLLSLGNIPWLKLPNSHTLNKLPIDETVSKLRPATEEDKRYSKQLLYKTPVSEDENALYLAKEHCADIVISSSALKILVDNYGQNFDKEWNIPVRVGSHVVKDVDGIERSQRIVFIDKPMVKTIWTPQEKKQMFYKKSALASLTKIINYSFFNMAPPFAIPEDKDSGEDKGQTGYDDDIFDLASTAEHDTFGVDPAVHSVSENSGIRDKRKINKQGNSKCDKKGDINSLKETDNSLLSDKSTEDRSEETEDGKSSCSETNTGTGKTKTRKSKKKRKKKTELEVSLLPETTLSSPLKDCTGANPTKVSESINYPPNILPTSSSIPQDITASVSDSGSSVLDNLLSMQDSFLKPTQKITSPIKSKDEASETTPNLKPWSNSLNTDWKAHSKGQNCPYLSGINVHYQLFSFGINSSEPCESSQPLRILIRHSVHGLSRFKNEKLLSKAYTIYPKLENQAYFGCEVNTLSEITQQWIQLLTRPNTTLLQVRVCESSGEIMMAEEKDLPMVLKEGQQPHIGFQPHQPLATLHSVFSAVCRIVTGHYILHHDPKTEAFITLLKATDSDKELHLQKFNLHAVYSTGSVNTKNYTVPPWLALDTHVLTPFHLKHCKIPATFPMDNPTKVLTKGEKRKIKEKAKLKRKLEDLDKPKEEDATEDYMEAIKNTGTVRRRRREML